MQPEYLTQFLASYRVHDQFPSKLKYNEMIRIVKIPKGEAGGVSRDRKRRVQKMFRAETQDGKELVLCKETGKSIMKQSEFLNFMKIYHDEAGHPGRDITFKKLQDTFLCVPRVLVSSYIKNCVACNNRRPIPKPVVGKPIYAKGPMERVQIDLIDMRSKPDGIFNWILHARDHFSKFSWAYSLQQKTCKDVTSHLRGLFFVFGPPKFLQSDNGGEFTGHELNNITFLQSKYTDTQDILQYSLLCQRVLYTK